MDCRDVGWTDNYFRHDASVTYAGDVWTIRGGLRNVFDEWPPQIDTDEIGSAWNNTPMGRGYDIMGRMLFLNVIARFGE